MKTTLMLLFFGLIINVAQSQKTEIAADRELTMGQVEGSSADGIYRYYKPGENKPFTGILYARYENGNYKSRQEYVDGIGEGTWINYWENGKPKEMGIYKQNKVEGPIKKYYESGVLKSEGIYKEWRIRVGVWKYYNEQGALQKTEDYGEKGDFRDVEEYYQKGLISKDWYERIKQNQ